MLCPSLSVTLDSFTFDLCTLWPFLGLILLYYITVFCCFYLYFAVLNKYRNVFLSAMSFPVYPCHLWPLHLWPLHLFVTFSCSYIHARTWIFLFLSRSGGAHDAATRRPRLGRQPTTKQHERTGVERPRTEPGATSSCTREQYHGGHAGIDRLAKTNLTPLKVPYICSVAVRFE